MFDNDKIERVATRYGRMYIPSNDTVIGRSLRIYGEWAEHEIDCISKCISRPGAILDIGANLGTHTMALAMRHPECTIYGFEPQTDVFQLLAANVVFNRLRNIRTFNFGCAEKSAVHFFAIDVETVGGNGGAVSFLNATDYPTGTSPFAFLSLDSMEFDAPVRFLKIDVEGMELQVLRGARHLIATDQPHILFEVLDLAEAFNCLDYIERFGYRAYWLSTKAFNKDNFNNVEYNIWGHGELSLLSVPIDMPRPEFLPMGCEVLSEHRNLSTDSLMDVFGLPFPFNERLEDKLNGDLRY